MNSATGIVPVSRLFIDYRGYVGIDAVPTEKLDVNGNINTGTANKVLTGSIELGHATDTTLTRGATGRIAVEGVLIPTVSSTDTFTNKRITKRVDTAADRSGTATINIDTCDIYEITAMTNDTTFDMTGSATDGQGLIIRMKASGANRTLTWDGRFVPIGVTLPTTIYNGKWTYVGVQLNGGVNKWHVIAVSQEV